MTTNFARLVIATGVLVAVSSSAIAWENPSGRLIDDENVR